MNHHERRARFSLPQERDTIHDKLLGSGELSKFCAEHIVDMLLTIGRQRTQQCHMEPEVIEHMGISPLFEIGLLPMGKIEAGPAVAVVIRQRSPEGFERRYAIPGQLVQFNARPNRPEDRKSAKPRHMQLHRRNSGSGQSEPPNRIDKRVLRNICRHMKRRFQRRMKAVAAGPLSRGLPGPQIRILPDGSAGISIIAEDRYAEPVKLTVAPGHKIDCISWRHRRPVAPARRMRQTPQWT
ncbi:MAG TPA: hypothetical protein VNQ99_09335 [Xanthobacteraceae bacterium]|nr:hypothetical protein [Xanthobacteraceae bacterium]